MNKQILEELELQITEVIGMLSLATYSFEDGVTSDEIYWIKQANARLVGLRQGLAIVIENAPPTNEEHDEAFKAFEARTSSGRLGTSPKEHIR